MKSDNGFVRVQKIITPLLIYLIASMIVEVVAMGAASFLVQVEHGSSVMNDYNAFYTYVMEYIYDWILYLTGAIAVLTLPILLILYYKDSKRLDMVQPDVSPIMYAVASVLGIAVCFVLNAVLAMSGLSELLGEGYAETATAIYSQRLWLQYLVTAILVPCMEELIFRGLIFRRLRTYSIFPLAALISAILFGVYHMNLLQFIYATCLGIVLALAYEKFRSILAPIVIHGTANAFSVLLSTNEGVQILLGGTQERMIVSTLAAGVITAVCIYALAAMNKKGGRLSEDTNSRNTVL